MGAAASIIGGVCEEFIFRSYLISAFSEYVPTWLAATLTLALFEAINVIGFGWLAIVTFGLSATPVTTYVPRSGKLIPAILAHAPSDLVIFLILLPMATNGMGLR